MGRQKRPSAVSCLEAEGICSCTGASLSLHSCTLLFIVPFPDLLEVGCSCAASGGPSVLLCHIPNYPAVPMGFCLASLMFHLPG